MRGLLVAVLLAGCTASPNTQRLPIGSPCRASDNCGTAPYSCALDYPDGYCQKDCVTNGDCPMDSLCAGRFCRRACQTAGQCRPLTEGYTCRAAAATSTVCELAGGGARDGGSTTD